MQQTTDMIDRVHNLERTGMNRAQAEALTKLMRDSIAEALEPVVRNMATKAEVADLKAHVDAQAKDNKAQIELLRSEIAKEVGKSMRYAAFTISLSTIAIIATVFTAAFFTMPAAG